MKNYFPGKILSYLGQRPFHIPDLFDSLSVVWTSHRFNKFNKKYVYLSFP